MNSLVAIDLSRLFLAPLKLTPQGIDRVELAYARHFLNDWSGGCAPVLRMPWGVRRYRAERGRGGLKAVDALWGETTDPADDAAFQAVRASLLGRPQAQTKRRKRSAAGYVRGFGEMISATGFSLGRAVRALPRDSIYLNVGQFSLPSEGCVSWLRDRPDVAGVFMLHDAIPIEHPEFCSPRSTRAHWRMIQHTAKYAKGLIVQSETALAAVRTQLQRAGRADIPAIVVPLPVPDAFRVKADPDPELAGVPYFVICGTIEARKNHLLLLNAWRELVRELGAAAPKLVVAGVRQSTGRPAIEMMEGCAELRDHVIEVSGMSTPGLRALLAGARALLMPSFAEGFGLPIVEALAQGTPAIVSDIPAHREAAGPHAVYLAPRDGSSWLSAIRSHSNGGRNTAAAQLAAGFRPRSWREYFADLEPFLMSVARRAQQR